MLLCPCKNVMVAHICRWKKMDKHYLNGQHYMDSSLLKSSMDKIASTSLEVIHGQDYEGANSFGAHQLSKTPATADSELIHGGSRTRPQPIPSSPISAVVLVHATPWISSLPWIFSSPSIAKVLKFGA